MENEALLAACLAAPHDMTPRLVYADWLDENGQCDRAEFIRVQIEEAKVPFHECDSIYPGCAVSGGRVMQHDHKCRAYPHWKRAGELHHKLNYGPWPEQGFTGWSWRCGFVQWFSGPLAVLLENGPAIAACNPIEWVSVTDANIGKITPSAPHSRYRIWNSVGNQLMTDLGMVLIGYYRSRESALSKLNAAVLATIRQSAPRPLDAGETGGGG